MMNKILQQIWEIAGAVNVRTKILGIILGLVILLGTGVNDLLGLPDLLKETIANNPNIRYAFIMDDRGQVIAHTFEGGFPLDLIPLHSSQIGEHHHTALIQTDEGLVWDTAVPILDGKVGTARIGLSDASVRAALSTLTAQLLPTTLLVSIAGILVAVFLTWVLTRPIISLVHATQAVAKGDFSPRVPRWANDEIGDLAEAFNSMTEELARTDELRKEREVLRRQLLEKVISTQEDERRRIARELHDSTSQNLTSLISASGIEAWSKWICLKEGGGFRIDLCHSRNPAR